MRAGNDLLIARVKRKEKGIAGMETHGAGQEHLRGSAGRERGDRQDFHNELFWYSDQS
jgi:hypothetical protein